MRLSLALSSILLLGSMLAVLAVESSSTCKCEASYACHFEPYGRRPTDIRDYGVRSPCPRHGHVVCCDRSREFDNNPTRSGIPSPSSVRGGQVPCVPAGDCRIKYGLSVYDIALFGVVGHCRVLSATRCLQTFDDYKYHLSITDSIVGDSTTPTVQAAQNSTGTEEDSPNAGLINDLKNLGVELMPPSTRVKEDGTVVIDGGSPLVVADEGGSEPRVFNTFGELEQAERVSPPPQGLVITAGGDVLVSPSGQSVQSASALDDTFEGFEEVPVTMWSPDGSQTATFTVKRDELQDFVLLFSDI